MIKSTAGTQIFQRAPVLKSPKGNDTQTSAAPPQANAAAQAELRESFQRTDHAQELMDRGDVAESSGKKNLLKTAGFALLGVVGAVAGGPVGIAAAAGGLLCGTVTSFKAAKDMKESNTLREKAFEILTPGQTPSDPNAPLTMMETPLQ